MHTHKQIAGILFIAFSALQLLGMLLLSFFISLATQFILDEADLDEQWVVMWLIPAIRALAWGIVLLVALPGLVAGIGLVQQKRWALTLALVLACFKLLSFPFGTGLGIYTIWIYLEDKKQHPTATPTTAA